MRFSFGLQFIITTALLSLFINNSSLGQKPYLLTDTTIIHRLDAHVEIFIDSTNSISIDQVAKPGFQHHFRLSNNNLTFGYLKASIWIRVKTQTASPNTQWHLEIPAPFLEYVDFYQLRKGETWYHSEAGYYRTHSARDISHTGLVLPLQFSADSISTVYVRIAGLSPKTFPLYAIEKECAGL